MDHMLQAQIIQIDTNVSSSIPQKVSKLDRLEQLKKDLTTVVAEIIRVGDDTTALTKMGVYEIDSGAYLPPLYPGRGE